jgi:hypothetical protein
MNEQEAKDAAIKNALDDLSLPHQLGHAIPLEKVWQSAMEYRQQDDGADAFCDDCRCYHENECPITLNIALESVKRLQAENQRLRTALKQSDDAIRLALIVFRAIDTRSFEDDEHESLIIAETVKKLQAVVDTAEAALGGE